MAKKTTKQGKAAAKRPAGKDGGDSVLEANPALKTTVGQIEKKFGEGPGFISGQ